MPTIPTWIPEQPERTEISGHAAEAGQQASADFRGQWGGSARLRNSQAEEISKPPDGDARSERF